MPDYDKPPELYDGLRLHQNENTAGCSPRVIAALAKLRPEQISVYPPYSRAVDACARHFGVPSSWVALTNGLDEGIMAAAITYLKPRGETGARGGDRAAAGVRDLRGRRGRRRRPGGPGPAAAGFQLSARGSGRRHHRSDAHRVRDQPEQPDGHVRDDRRGEGDRPAAAAGRDRIRRRSLCRLRGRPDIHPASRRSAERCRWPDVRQGLRPGGAAARRAHRRARRRSTRSGRRSASTA